MSTDDYEYIDESEMPKGSRGRPNECDPKLVEMLKGMPKGRSLVIKAMAFSNPSDKEAYDRHKANKGANIRSAAKVASVRVSVTWDKGIPYVKVVAKTK